MSTSIDHAPQRVDELGTRSLVVGALGVTGRNVLQHLADSGRAGVGMSRRRPLNPVTGATHLIGDVTDPDSHQHLRNELRDVTHLAFAAYQELPSLQAQVAPNVGLLEGSLDMLAAAGAPLRHVTLYQGNKYYGAHLGAFKTPAREDDPRLPGPNFYYDQEDLLRERASRDGYDFTILRPEAVCGVATGNPMNLLTAIAVYGTVCRDSGIPMRFPGSDRAADVLYQVTDARLLARATAWAGLADTARNEAFNITNGDTFRWRHMFGRFADYFGITSAAPQRLQLATHMPSYRDRWSILAAADQLNAVPFEELASWGFADAIFGSEWDNVSSTVKLRQAGFQDCIDTEQMFIELFGDLASGGFIPPGT